MAPSEKSIEAALKNAVKKIFHSKERENLTVNTVRSTTETDINLKEGFLKGGAWKDKSKAIVKAEIEQLLNLEEAGAEVPASQPPAKSGPVPTKKVQKETVKKGTKRSSDGAKAQPRKRQKREATPSPEEEESALTSAEDTPEEPEESDFSESPRPKKASKVAPESAPRRGKKKVESSSDEEDEVDSKPSVKGSPKLQKKTTPRKRAVNSDDDAKDKLDPNNEKIETEAPGKRAAETQVAADSESELSVVLDEPPKRKSRTTKSNSKTKATASKKAVPKVKGSCELTADEAEVKLLQSHLQKCGIRKIWGVEMKQFGNDAKAKIRHLRQMLRDAGVEGRFSEAKAAEIKEMRELQADLEAVKEGDMKWGMGRGSRSTKNKKSMAVDVVTEEEDEDEDEDISPKGRDGSASVKGRERIPRAKMDLTFLGDESDSD